MRRVLLGLIVVLSSLVVTLAVVPVATAQRDVSAPVLAAPAGDPLPPHDVRWVRRGERGDKFWTKGKVVTWKNRLVTLQSARRRNGHWTAVKTDRTTADQGVWNITFDGEVGRFYRVLIPKANWARATKVYVGKIVTED